MSVEPLEQGNPCERYAAKLTVHQLGNNFLLIDHYVGLLAVHPTLSVLISITEDRHFIVEHREFDMTVSLFLDCVQRSDLILTSVPANGRVSLRRAWYCSIMPHQ
jgi:hypothetical protein